jgi:hypothetical protein
MQQQNVWYFYKSLLYKREAQLYPKTYRLYNKEDCLQILEILKDPDYRRNITNNGPSHIIKVDGMHRGSGIFV